MRRKSIACHSPNIEALLAAHVRAMAIDYTYLRQDLLSPVVGKDEFRQRRGSVGLGEDKYSQLPLP